MDIYLVRGMDSNQTKAIIIENFIGLCGKLVIVALAEGMETAGERDFLSSIGINLI